MSSPVSPRVLRPPSPTPLPPDVARLIEVLARIELRRQAQARAAQQAVA